MTVKIDLESTIEPTFVSEDLTHYIFPTNTSESNTTDLHVIISKHPDPFLPNVYNLAFGPMDENGQLDDKAKIHHLDINKVFSTIILFAIAFLEENPKMYIGIDGSNETRAYLYHRMFLSNQQQLSDIVVTIGVDWYVRLLRNGTDIERDTDGFPFFKPRPEPFDINRRAADLYRYYMIKLKNG